MPIKPPKRSLVYRSTYAWNSLPQSVVDAPSLQSFGGKLDKLWKNHPIKNDFYCSTSTMNCVTFRRMCSVSKQCSRQSKHKRHENLIQAREGPVIMIKNNQCDYDRNRTQMLQPAIMIKYDLGHTRTVHHT